MGKVHHINKHQKQAKIAQQIKTPTTWKPELKPQDSYNRRGEITVLKSTYTYHKHIMTSVSACTYAHTHTHRHTNKKVAVSMLIFGKLDFRSKNIIRDKDYDIIIEKMKTN